MMVLSAGGLFSVHNYTKSIAAMLRQYSVPYIAALLATGFAAALLEHLRIEGLSLVCLEWIAENVAYYAAVSVARQFSCLNSKEKPKPLIHLFWIEGLDIVVRMFLLGLAGALPKQWQCLGATCASGLADIAFALALSRSHRLVEICVEFSTQSCRPEPLILRFA